MGIRLNVIVTGASGFIGKQVVKRLLLNDFKVFAISRKYIHQFENDNLVWTSWERYKNDLSSEYEIFAVVNLATTYGHGNESWSEILQCNVALPVELFKYAIELGVQKIINADSFFGKPDYDYQFMQSYIKSKNMLVAETKKLVLDEEIAFINLRLEHVFGANDGPNKFVSKLIRDFQSNKNYIELTDGTQKRDFIYIEDVVSAFIRVLQHAFSKGFIEYEVGTGKSIELKLFCLELAKAFGVSPDIFQFGKLDHRPNEIMNSSADIEEITSIGWAPTWDLDIAMTDLAEKQHFYWK